MLNCLYEYSQWYCYSFLLQVTGFGQKGEGDTGDDWKVVCEGAGYFR